MPIASERPVAADRGPFDSASRDLLQRVAIIIPTYNAESHWPVLSRSLLQQGVPPDQILVIDSSSTDGTQALARAAKFRVVTIPQAEFNHGATRQRATQYVPDAELLLFATQDVEFATPDSVLRLCKAMDDPRIGAAYGRQLPRRQAGPIERHARLFNYPAQSHTRTIVDRDAFGIRTAFLSNSFAVYRRSALEAVGGFPADVIFGEDTYVAAKMLAAGWSLAYEANAQVIHSHPFTLRQEFRRYFDIGSHHARESWMLKASGKASGEGMKFVGSELRYLYAHSPSHIPIALVRTASKLLAYRLGLLSPRLPKVLNRRMAGDPKVWE